MVKQVNIICRGRGWELAPLTGESWGISKVLHKRSLDVMFEMHNIFEHCRNTGEVIHLVKMPTSLTTYKIAADNNIPSYSLEEYQVGDLKFKKYPIREILDEFNETLFNCSTDYMIALAIYKKYEQIDVYGVNLAYSEEYIYQRPSVEFWRGFARGRGVDIKFHGRTGVGKTVNATVYGYNIPQKKFMEIE